MRANTTPMMLAMVILILRPKVMTRIPKLIINGESKPKDCPKFSQDSQDTSCAIVPINPPSTIPVSTRRSSTQQFFRFICYYPSFVFGRKIHACFVILS